ncbi:MAG: hypothetical protein AAGA46_00560 [Cyanobacteria bacterium P01_F01_bin.13]
MMANSSLISINKSALAGDWLDFDRRISALSNIEPDTYISQFSTAFNLATLRSRHDSLEFLRQDIDELTSRVKVSNFLVGWMMLTLTSIGLIGMNATGELQADVDLLERRIDFLHDQIMDSE